MKRPLQHIIETESKKHFNMIIPDNWVVRDMPSDYGIDLMIEIFKDSNATGNYFFVQLKGNSQKIIDNKISYQLKASHIDYYKSIPNPVLFVIYSTEEKKFWAIWSNNLINSTILTNKKNKTYKINLDEKHIVTKVFFENLEHDFSINIPHKVNVTGEYNSENGRLLHSQIIKRVKYFYDEYIDIDNSKISDFLKITYEENPDNKMFVKIITNYKEYTLTPISFLDNSYLYYPILDNNKFPKETKELLFLISYIFRKYDIKRSLELITKTINEYEGIFLTPIFLFDLIKEAVESAAFFELQTLADFTIETNMFDIFQLVNMGLVMFNSDDRVKYMYQKNLIKAIGECKDYSLKGTFCYNLANSYRYMHELYLASKYYQLARKYKPIYLEKHYWWFEYAGVMFLSQHYYIAEKFYTKSHKLNELYNIHMYHFLLADTLFFQGKFEEARRYYNICLSTNEKEPKNESAFYEEAFLKEIVCGYIISFELNNSLFDYKKSEILTEEGINVNNQDKFLEAIKLHPLNGLAWFNLAISFTQVEDFESSLCCFLTCACIQDWDKEAWGNCFALSFNLHNVELLIAIYIVVMEKHGEEFLNYLTSLIFQKSSYSHEAKLALIQAFTKIHQAYKTESDNKK